MSKIQEEFRKIHEFKRKGASSLETWKLILDSKHYQKAWIIYKTNGTVDLYMWQFLLDESRSFYLESWIKKNKKEANSSETKWIHILLDYPLYLRREALLELTQLDLTISETLYFLFLFLEDPSTIILRFVENSLAHLNLQIFKGLPELRRQLKSTNSNARRKSLELLARLGNRAAEAIPDITNLLIKEKDKQTKWAAAKTLRCMNKLAIECLPALIQVLENEENPYLCHEVIQILGMLGPEAQEAVPILNRFIHSEHHFLFQSTINALNQIVPEFSKKIPFSPEEEEEKRFQLLKMLWSDSKEFRYKNAIQIATERSPLIDSVFTELLAALIEALEDRETLKTIRRNAAKTLGNFGKNASDAIPVLEKTQNDHDKYLRPSVRNALKKIKREINLETVSL